MPWMPEVFSSPLAETLPTQQEKELESANDAIPYYEGIMSAIPQALVRSFAAQRPVLDDPRLGYVEGARQLLSAFAMGMAEWLGERDDAHLRRHGTLSRRGHVRRLAGAAENTTE